MSVIDAIIAKKLCGGGAEPYRWIWRARGADKLYH